MLEISSSEKNLWPCDPVVDVPPVSPELQHISNRSPVFYFILVITLSFALRIGSPSGLVFVAQSL